MNILFNLSTIPHWEFMIEAQRWEALPPAYREFMTTKPNPPGHAEYLARARKKHPSLPGGAAQAALNCFEMRGAKAAARYAANAGARWRVQGKFKFVMPAPSMRGVWNMTAKDKREQAERLERYREHMEAGRQALEQQRLEKAAKRKAQRENRRAKSNVVKLSDYRRAA